MPTVRIGPVAGLAAQVALLVALGSTIGLGVAGWTAGLAYGVVLYSLLTIGLRDVETFRPADWVTLARANLVGCVTALTADSFLRGVPTAVLVTIAAVALMLDAIDGQVARRTGTVSALGARFDMEVDAFLILVLSLSVARSLGAWVLAIGGMRYAYVAASWVLPWLRRPVPPRYWRKVVAATQGGVLVVAIASVLPDPLMVAAVLGALALLTESFGRDVVWQWRHRLPATAP